MSRDTAKLSAVPLALVALFAMANAQAQSRDNTGSTRIYNMPLASELETSSSCVADVATAQSQAQSSWQGVAQAQRQPVTSTLCQSSSSVSASWGGETLTHTTAGDLVTVQPDGQVFYQGRVGTLQRGTAYSAPAPAPAPTASYSSSDWVDYSSAYTASPSPAPAADTSNWWASWDTSTSTASASPTPAPAPAPASIGGGWYVEPTPVAAPAPAPAPVASGGNCLWTNTCGGTEAAAESWGANVWSPSPAPAPASGGGSGWSLWGSYWDQP